MVQTLKVGEARKQARAQAEFVRETFDLIADRYDLLNRLISLGRHTAWKRRAAAALRAALDEGAWHQGNREADAPVVVDLACGTGDLAAFLVAEGLRVVGVDFSQAMLDYAHCRCPLLCAGVTALPFADGSFDGAVTGFALRNVESLPSFFAETRRVLKPGAPLVVLEVGTPRLLAVFASACTIFVG